MRWWEDHAKMRRHMAEGWKPGHLGKGVVMPTGGLVTWNLISDYDADDYPYHAHATRALGLSSNYADVQSAFSISKTGVTRAWGGTNPRATPERIVK